MGKFPKITLNDLPAVGAVGITRPNDPAFARPASGDDQGTLGLSKREYFAGEAMKGILAGRNSDEGFLFSETTDDAVRAADALIDRLNMPKDRSAGA